MFKFGRLVTEIAEVIAKRPPLPNEIRMHPDDIEELREVTPDNQSLVGHAALFGIKIIVDINAPRLRRKQLKEN